MRAAVNPMVRTAFLALSLLAAALALPAASAGVNVCDAYGVCVDREGVCVTTVYWLTYDFGAGAGNCPEAALGPHGVGACEAAWAGMGGWGGFTGVVVSVCGGVDSEGNACLTPYAQVNEWPSTLKPLCLA